MADNASGPGSRAPAGSPSAQNLVVAGLGASAGGIKALKSFFSAISADSGLAYVVILHLSPEHESRLAEVLQTVAPIPILQVRGRVRVEPDRVYVVSPNHSLALNGDFIQVSPIADIEERRAPVDLFFRTLAEVRQSHAVSIVLSGTGANGSMGMKHVKEYGGCCIVQDPNEADFPDMPRNSLATGLVDYVLPVGEIPKVLASYCARLAAASVPARDNADEVEQSLSDIFSQMRIRTGHVFADYKRSTVLRRIDRRMAVREIANLPDYARFLREHRDEARALLRDLLISVTNFFRDAEAFEALQHSVIPMLLDGKGPDDSVRIWVAGCATGEEAYSMAIVLAEALPETEQQPSVQIFATDIDEGALAKARAGLYTLNDAADVSPQRLRRFFVKDGDSFRVRPELREMVLFATHNVIKDPPFLHLDLVACRNVLIYLNRNAQERVLRLFHFGMHSGGYLLLGNSESPEETGSLFVAVDKEHHIYQSRGVASVMPLPIIDGMVLPGTRTGQVELAPEARKRDRISYLELHQRLLEQYAPASLVANQDFEILHLSEAVGRYLHFVAGEPSQNLLKVVKPELRLELHSALYQALEHRTGVDVTVASVSIDGKSGPVKISIRPVFGDNDPSRGLILVLFEPVNSPQPQVSGPAAEVERSQPIAYHLEEELVRVRQRLRNTIEHHELQEEELKASNEELQAMNEELRSSAEELETSKEELQSVNEELTTVNQELKIKIEELSQAHNDTRNLMNSTDFATVFIDRGLRIKLFTPRAFDIFNLIPVDLGRPLLDITHRLKYAELARDIDQVLDTLAVAEREVPSFEGRWYIARISPYRTAEDRIAGVVLTFTDITARKRAEEALRESEMRVRLMVENIPDYAIFTTDTKGIITTWNEGAREIFGYEDQTALGRHIGMTFTPEDRAAGVPEGEIEQARSKGRAADERWHLRKDGSRVYLSGVMAPLVIGGETVGYTKVARDLTERQATEQELRLARAQLEARVEERTRELQSVNAALRLEIDERTQSEAMRISLLRALVNAQEQERSRISRELHDQLGQEITVLGLRLAALRSGQESSPALTEQIAHLEAMVKNLDRDVDFLVWELRPTGLDDLGLSEALSDYVSNWSTHHGVAAHLESYLDGRLDPEVETVLYRIAQEALHNVQKHAQAKHVELVLHHLANEVALTVVDDGIGFDPDAQPQDKTLGLISIRERAALLGGTMTIASEPGGGTTILVRIPPGGGRADSRSR